MRLFSFKIGAKMTVYRLKTIFHFKILFDIMKEKMGERL